MPTQTPDSVRSRSWWIAGSILLLGMLVLAFAAPSWAAPPYQTVPIPTPTQERPDQPTATPTSRADDGDNDGGDRGDGAGAPAQPAQPPGSEAPAGLTGVVNTPTLNVRSGPGAEFSAIGQLTAGDLVTVLGQSADGTWWAICCAPPTDATGWVSARFINPTFNRSQVVLPVLDNSAAAATPQPGQDANAAAIEPSFALTLTARQEPQYVWQNQLLTMAITVSNPSEEAAQDVALRNDIPDGLIFVEARASDGGSVEEATVADASVLTIQWAALESRSEVTAALVLRIDATVADGAVIDNLVAVGADNAASASGGITVALPPATPPDFK